MTRQAARVRELDGGDADAAGRAVHQHGFARLRAGALEQRAIRGAVRHAERRALAEATRAPAAGAAASGLQSARSAYVPAPATVLPRRRCTRGRRP